MSLISGTVEALVTCRAGLESIVAAELEDLDLSVTRKGKRAVFFISDLGGIYRANMGLRSAISVLVPIRTFNARDYDLLYYQARRTNWHQLFDVDKSVRIDVNGRSNKLTHTQYVTHRVKDGIVDTFRKLTKDGRRPSIDKADPEVHVIVHLDGTSVTLCIDTSAVPLFKRGYRLEHGEAPIKEDLAAGMLQLAGMPLDASHVIDPMCGSGTFLFESYMLAKRIAPNLNRTFGFESLIGYDAELHASEKAKLAAREISVTTKFIGIDNDPEVVDLAQRIRERSFPDADIEIRQSNFSDIEIEAENGFIICNPPYGVRMGEEEAMVPLYKELGQFAKRTIPGGRIAVFSANRVALKRIGMKAEIGLTLFNGSLEGLLCMYNIHKSRPPRTEFNEFESDE